MMTKVLTKTSDSTKQLSQDYIEVIQHYTKSDLVEIKDLA